MWEWIKILISEHPDKLLDMIMSLIGFIVATYGTWIASKWSGYVSKIHENAKNQALVTGFELVQNVAFETVSGIYARRNQITDKVLADGKIDKNDAKILMNEALKDFRAKLIAMGKTELSKKDDGHLVSILEASYDKFKMLRDTIKANTAKK